MTFVGGKVKWELSLNHLYLKKKGWVSNMIRKMLRNTLKNILFCIVKIMSMKGFPYMELAMRYWCQAYERYSDYYCMYRLFPQKANRAFSIDLGIKTPQFAIVIQGPLDREDDFTLETVRLYRIYYPDAYIIVSTWDNEDKEFLKKIKNEGAVVVTSSYPDKPGRGNVNYQKVSTLNGLKKAKELGAEYVLKNRSDMRMYRRNVLAYMYALCKEFPVDKKGSNLPNARIIADGAMFDSEWLQDFWYFGHIDDMLNLYNAPIDQSDEYKKYNEDKSLREEKTRKEFCSIFAPAQYYIRHYLSEIGAQYDGIKEYWENMQKYFLCIGWEELEFYWHKYDIRHSMNRRQQLDLINDTPEYPKTYKWMFSNWFLLYCDLIKYDESFENYEKNHWILKG